MTERPQVVIERTFAASPEVVWEMWTDPDRFAGWYGPPGAAITIVEMDVHVGGRRHLCMEMPTPDGPMQMWFVGEFREVVNRNRLVYTDAMADADGTAKTAAEMGLPEGHPAETEVVVELEAVDDGTKMTMTHVGIPPDSPGASGWQMAFDKLALAIAEALA